VDKRAENTIVATAAMAMMTAVSAENESHAQFFERAEELWRNRHNRAVA